jgi:type VI secretion system Hcp family effector
MRTPGIVLVAAMAVILFASAAHAAPQFYVQVTGVKQGVFKGEDAARSKGPRANWLAGTKLFYEVKTSGILAPRAGTGVAGGKPQHGSITFTKAVGAATPQFFQALVTNEVLKTVEFNFVRTNPNGEEYVSYIIRLTNATVSGHKHYFENILMEDISLGFQRIEVTSNDGKTMAMDDLTR